MTTFMEFGTENGTVLVEADGLAPGQRPVSRGGNSLVRAGQTLDGALAGIRAAAESALAVFRGGSLQPDGVELEFGVKLTAEAGAVIAKTAVEGHLTVRLSWTPDGRGVDYGVSVPERSAEPQLSSRDVLQRSGSAHEASDEALPEAR
ncbi:CU044_2847 family protein [Streptomyces rubiginosohelvolus]|uniref:CU044_2847 family protein n=1 Tax=Streptomyces rubiginosohelvolus TaxID=67362 RepID=UPI00367D5294